MANAAKDRDMFRLAYRHAESLDQSFAQLAFDAQNWPRDMLLVFSTAWEKVEAEYTHFQGALKRKRETLRKELKEVAALVEAYKDVVDASELEGLFGWDTSDWPQVGELAKELEPYASLWQVVSEYALRSEDWLYGNMQGLNPEEVEELTGEWYKRMQRLAKSMQLAEHRRLAEESRVKLEGFKALLPIISAVCNPGMRGRHWDALSKAVGAPVWPGEELQLSRLVKLGISNHLEALQDISDAASREHALERQLDKMQVEWSGVVFAQAPWKNTGGFILKGSAVEEAQLLLDDHTIKSQAMQSSPAAAPFLERIEAWVKKLASMQDIFDAWLTAQSKWMYLGPVYGSEEIAKQMPKERNEFMAADAKWRRIMVNVQQQPEILQATDTEHLLDDLQACNTSFNVIERSLNAYLDSKKLLFPRFFFLSNDELIEILSEAKDPLNVQPFVKKIFEAVNAFSFNADTEITSMISIEGEVIPFDKPVPTQGDSNGVERWLLQAEAQMRASLATITANAMKVWAAG
ncbi:uncharacterized protein HaLaN_20201 [Haematococcus lacustris]|uniref:Dynein heavy chain linker domain-containing protein n=1 Tax=Haematococcus lacustris TaxID=44745 RepID=A0A699ZVJ2_HAELA|nr:uncharacterized protein HaLaN_20201 [Haematococcus lacustris]